MRLLILIIFLSSRCVFSIADFSHHVQTENVTHHQKGEFLAKVLDFYNTELLRMNWEKVRGNVSEGCEMDVQKYLEGLEAAKGWALRSK